MYAWIWRTLPGGLAGKLVSSLLLVLTVVAVLFLYVFPAVEPLLPLGDVTVDGDPTAPAPAPSP